MTIKEFASLCGCNAQTLRYYDKIGLLKPVRVDQWSGYRYYAREQAVAFVKIKNLQAADFTIGEIKELLTLPDSQVYAAFEGKIEEQEQKLERIRKIQQSYLTEKSNMEKIVQSVSGFLLHAISDYELLQEFGLSAEEGPAIVAKLKDYIDASTRRYLPAEPEVRMILNDQVICGADRIADAFEALKGKGYEDTVLIGDKDVGSTEYLTPENSESAWECHDWGYVHEFIRKIPKLTEEYEYCFHFRLTEDKYSDGLEFPMFMIAAMLPQLESEEISLGCSIKRSEDGKNHFVLLRK